MGECVNQSCFFCLGLNYQTSPVSIREKFSISRGHLAEVDCALRALPGVEECVLLSTCNRTEAYYCSTAPEEATKSIWRYFMGNAGGQREEVASCFYRYAGEEALFHLACVAAGLDSMVLGETEIFGQLKEAYRIALESKVTGKRCNQIFQQIFSLGKKVRSQTRITSGPTSVGAAAVQVAHDLLGGVSGRQVLIVGAGDVARSTAQSLKSRGAESIFVANRSYERAVELAGQVGGRVIRFADWIPYLEQIDIVIVSTAAPVYVVSPSILCQTQQLRGNRPLYFIDLSVPRNVDPACALVPGVRVDDMDAMEAATEETRQCRMRERVVGEMLIHSWLAEAGHVALAQGGILQQTR